MGSCYVLSRDGSGLIVAGRITQDWLTRHRWECFEIVPETVVAGLPFTFLANATKIALFSFAGVAVDAVHDAIRRLRSDYPPVPVLSIYLSSPTLVCLPRSLREVALEELAQEWRCV